MWWKSYVEECEGNVRMSLRRIRRVWFLRIEGEWDFEFYPMEGESELLFRCDVPFGLKLLPASE
jgi:hypothetical protein